MFVEPGDVMVWLFVGMFGYGVLSAAIGSPVMRIWRKRKFYKIVTKGIENCRINTIGDVIDVHTGIFSTEDEANKYNVLLMLHECLPNIVADSDVNHDKVRCVKKIREFLKEIKPIMPYWELPEPERNCLTEIHELVDNNDFGAVRIRLKDLAGLIKTKEDIVAKLARRSKVLTVIGIIISIVFGILPLILQ